jgi:glyoxylase-like metal-dependent hydrolase (beta-lactamase superfamily II)/ferredoxin
MADPKKSLATNVSGNFFVDSTCIDCDTCRQLAPRTFVEDGSYSAVFRQPENDEEVLEALRALVCCPTASIGTHDKTDPRPAVASLPLRLADSVFYCGFNSEESYGANSFFIQHDAGNWLIDSPRHTAQLVKKFAEMGGIKYVFLSHRDDVADAERYAKEFSASRIIHARDASASPGAEIIIDGTEEFEPVPGFKIIPTPGHTAGHAVLLFNDRHLFTGDHLAFDRESRRLTAFRDHCWFSWSDQTKSMESLLKYSFEYVLAGHGDRVKLERIEMKAQLARLVERMKLSSKDWHAA